MYPRLHTPTFSLIYGATLLPVRAHGRGGGAIKSPSSDHRAVITLVCACASLPDGEGRFRGVRERVAAHDLASVHVRLVGSVPGFHRRPARDDWGHMRLRAHLAATQHGSDTDVLIAQYSSLGKLGKEATWLDTNLRTSMSGGAAEARQPPLIHVYPTVDDVRNSLEGWAAGGALPHNHAYVCVRNHTVLLRR